MAISLNNFSKELSKDLLLQAGKYNVRECDEIEKGKFVAYVDECEDSFDVSITINKEKNIISDSCDCKDGNSFCKHKAALLLFLVKDKKPAATIKIKANKPKKNQAIDLLNDIDLPELRSWVQIQLEKNKELELSFLSTFSQKTQLTPDDISKTIKNAIKAVAGSKKTLDAAQTRKLVELWSEVLSGTIQHYLANTTDAAAFLNIQAIFDDCKSYADGLRSSEEKISAFLTDIMVRITESISDLSDIEEWEKSVSYFIKYLPVDSTHIRLQYIYQLSNILYKSKNDASQATVELLAEQFARLKSDKLVYENIYNKLIFDLVMHYGLLAKYIDLFQPLPSQVKYNIQLINFLMQSGNFKRAETFCNIAIQQNYYEELNLPYLELLKEIYKQSKDKMQMLKICQQLIVHTFNLEDYLYVNEHLPEMEYKAWHTKTVSRISNAANHNVKAQILSFEILNIENNYKKMLSKITYSTDYRLILKYFNNLALTKKQDLISALLHLNDNCIEWTEPITEMQFNEVVAEIYIQICKHFPPGELKLYINSFKSNIYGVKKNRLHIYIIKQLQEIESR